MTPGTGGLDMMSPVIGLYYSFQHDKIFPRFILNKMFFTKGFMEFLLQIELAIAYYLYN